MPTMYEYTNVNNPVHQKEAFLHKAEAVKLRVGNLPVNKPSQAKILGRNFRNCLNVTVALYHRNRTPKKQHREQHRLPDRRLELAFSFIECNNNNVNEASHKFDTIYKAP